MSWLSPLERSMTSTERSRKWRSSVPAHERRERKRERVKARPRARFRLSEEIKRAVRRDVARGESYAVVARRYGVHERTVPKIVKT